MEAGDKLAPRSDYSLHGTQKRRGSMGRGRVGTGGRTEHEAYVLYAYYTWLGLFKIQSFSRLAYFALAKH